MTNPIDPRFKYESYEQNIFATRDELTAISKITLEPKTSAFGLILNAVRVAAILWLFKIRQAMFDEEMILGKQIYERRRSQSNRDDLKDDLDGVLK